MPNPFLDPLVPQSAIDPIQQLLEKRRLNQSVPEAQLLGFGSGALEGLRSLTSPLSLASMIPGGTAAKLIGMAPKAARLAGPAMRLAERAPTVISPAQRALIRQYLPTEFQQPVANAAQGLKRAIDPYHDEMVTKYLNKIGRQ